jgi:Fic family protein
MSNLKDVVILKKHELDTLRTAIRADGLAAFERAHMITITHTSTAIEGNVLTADETTLVLENGLTIGWKPMKDHFEVMDHAAALHLVVDLAQEDDLDWSEMDIRTIQQLVVARSEPEAAGHYSDKVRYVNTKYGVHHFPSPADIRMMMADFVDWLRQAPPTPDTAFEAHWRLVGIHPFDDGNGRTARLLMNWILLKAGYPAIAVRPIDRPAYISALECDQADLAGRGYGAFNKLLYQRLSDTLDSYIQAVYKVLPIKHGKHDAVNETGNSQSEWVP